jgi:hypothetical protein
MSSPSWLNLYYRLAAGSVIVVAIFGSQISLLHSATIPLLGIACPLLLAWLGGRFSHESNVSLPEPSSDAAAWPWFGLALFGAACCKFAVIGFSSSGFIPALHDEWSYLFGAETFARGHLTNPTPPRPEFFDAFHILCKPVWVTRYPPGHPAALTIGTLMGWPSAIVIVETAGTVLFTYLLARELASEGVARLAGSVALMAPGLDFLAGTYLSQSTFLCAITGCYAATLYGVRRQSWKLLAIAGLAGGWAILTRPYSAVALGFPLTVWFVSVPTGVRLLTRCRLLVAAGTPIVTAAVLFGEYNYAITGSPLKTAWGEYNRQFEPDNTLGFSSESSQPIPLGISKRKADRAQGIATEKLQFTWTAAVRRALLDPRRLCDMVFSAVGYYGLAAFLPFCFWSFGAPSRWSRSHRWLLGLSVTSHYVAYSLFYSTWGAYALETIPLVILLVAIGLGEFWQRARDCDRPGLAFVAPLFLVVAVFLDGREIGRLIERRQAETSYHRDFALKLGGLNKPSIVFVKFDPARVHIYDLINNSPDLNNRVLVVLDLDDRNSELLAQFPGRAAFLYEEATGQLIPLPPARRAPQARLPVHRSLPSATSADSSQTARPEG